jgi:hypothetical protein
MLPNSWAGPALRPKRPTRASACDPRFILDPAAAYLSGIGRKRLPHNVGQTLSSVNPAIAVTDWPYECSKP